MTDAEALKVALEYLSKREKELAALHNLEYAPSERSATEYRRVIHAMQAIEKMLRKPRQGGMF